MFKRWISILLLFPLLVMAEDWVSYSVEKKAKPSSVSVIGFYQPITWQVIRAAHSAKLMHSYQAFGSEVVAGDPIFLLDDPKLRLDIEEASLNVEKLTEELEKILHWQQSVTWIQAVRELELAQAEHEISAQHLVDTAKLVELGALAREVLIREQQSHERAKQQVKMAQLRFDDIQAKGNQLAISQARLALARAEVELNKLQQQQQALDIRAQHPGVLYSPQLFLKSEAMPVQIGDDVDSQQALAVIANLDDFGIIFELDDELMDKLAQHHRLYVRTQNEVIEAKMISAEPMQLTRDANQPNHYQCKVRLAHQPKHPLRLGHKVKVHIETLMSAKHVTIPLTAIRWEHNQSFVMKKQPHGWQASQITLGQVGDGWAQVKSGLEEGDIIGLKT